MDEKEPDEKMDVLPSGERLPNPAGDRDFFTFVNEDFSNRT
jgi:hypothetical protein